MKKYKGILGLLLFVTILSLGCKKGDAYDADKQLQVDEQLIKDFLTAQNIKNAERHPSGVYYIITQPGSGSVVYQGNTKIQVKYTGRLLNGQVFDSSQSLESILGELIVGWHIGIPLIQKGRKIRLLIPSVYGYGPSVQASIPANSVLDFDVELLNVGY